VDAVFKAYAFGGTGACGFFGASANFMVLLLVYKSRHLSERSHTLFRIKSILPYSQLLTQHHDGFTLSKDPEKFDTDHF